MTQQEMLNILVRVRRNIRRVSERIEMNRAALKSLKSEAKELANSGNRFNQKRAELMEPSIEAERSVFLESAKELRVIGEAIVLYGRAIDALIPQSVMLDFLEVNTADRSRVVPEDGFIELTFAKSLEYSATTRKLDYCSGPFRDAIAGFMSYQLCHNKKLREAADKELFGVGGMFEFLPRYKQGDNGEMIRQRPPLRVVKVGD